MGKAYTQRDAVFVSEKSYAAAGSSTSSDVFDLLSANGLVELEVALGEASALANGKKITATIMESDSADGSFNPAPWAPPVSISGGAEGGAADFEQRIAIASSAKRYIRLDVSVEAEGGDNTGGKFIFSAVF